MSRIALAAILIILLAPARIWAQAPSISSFAPTSGPIGMSVTISGSNFGSTQATSTVSLNGSTATVMSWSSTTIVAVVPFASSGPFSVVVNGQTATSSSFTVTALPSGWSDGDIGSVGSAGSATYSVGTFAMKGTGVGVWNTADGFNFAYQPLSGDGTIIARLVSASGGATGQSTGVMIRETLNANASNVYTLLGGGNSEIYVTERTSTGGSSSVVSNTSAVSFPYWVKLVRSGNNFSGYSSQDGSNWAQIGTTQTISMAQSVYVGLAISSNDNTKLMSATFDNVSITSAASPAPVITSLSSTTATVGTQITISGSNFGNTQNGSVVTLNAVPLTINSWSNISITVTVPTGALSGFLLVSTAPSMNDSNALAFYVQSLPGSWLDQDVGSSVISVGTAGYAGGTFTLQGAGSGVAGTSDGFHFAYQSLSGDGTIIARIASTGGTWSPQTFKTTTGSAGVMIRETLAPGAANVYLKFSLENSEIIGDYRSNTGGSTNNNLFNAVVVALPYWVKLARSGSTLTPSISSDGVNWTSLSSVTISMAQNVYLGLGVSSETSTTIGATFDNVSINSASAPAPVISSISENSGFIGSRVVISGSNFGSSQGASIVTLNAAPMTVNSWSSTSITFTVSGGSPGLLVVSVAPNMNDSNPLSFTLNPRGPTQQTATGWADTDVWDGTTSGAAGSASYDNGTFTVNGSGTGVWNTKDGFNFEYQPLSGNGTIVARLLSGSGGAVSQSTGIMIRETLLPYSTNVYTLLGGSNSAIYVTARTSTSGSSSVIGNTSPVNFPYWVKLVRNSNSFTGYSSSDGVNWTQVGTTTVSMAQNVYIGLAVSSNTTSTLTTATFDHVSITSSATSSPGTLVGSVTSDSGGTGINGAQVQALQQGVIAVTTSTNSSGAYTIANLAAGTYDLKFSATGFGTLVNSGVFVAAGLTETVNASLSAPGSISGTVTQSDGVTPISGAVVQASVGSALGSSATTNSSGAYSIAGLNEGAYVLQASASGYTTTTQSASVTANSATTANLSLLSQGSGASSYVYDALGRLVAVVLQNGNAAVYNYDSVGNLLSISRQSSNQLSILGFTPTLGPVGSTVTIYGTAFSTTPNQNTVKFNGIAATVQSATSTQLIVSIPMGATTGPISVTVSGSTVTTSASFTVGNP